MSSQLPHERIMVLEDKARLFDKIVVAHKRKKRLLNLEGIDASATRSLFGMEINKIMREADMYGFLNTHDSTNN